MTDIDYNNVLTENTFRFEGSFADDEKIPSQLHNYKFGILNFKAITTTETKKDLDFIFTVDYSGSMSDICSDGRTKIQHIIHTLKNMILFLHKNTSVNVNISVNIFNNKIYKIIKRVKINDNNLDNLLTKIDTIKPEGGTNIENALDKSFKYIQELKTNYPENLISHIFMTDGEATDGSDEISLLKGLVVDDVFNAFIGFGIDHDAGLLNSIASVGKSSYYFIDKLESSGLIYGEILHSIIYKILIDCELQLTNGLVYDFKTNSWVQNLKICDIISESNKTYNVISENPDYFTANIHGKNEGSDTMLTYPSKRLPDTDLSNHCFRQRTLQLLFEVNQFLSNQRKPINMHWKMLFMNYMDQYSDSTTHNIKEQKNTIKKKLASFMEEMKKFMSENQLTDDKFMKNLCDDIYICFRTFDTKYGNMFCSARQTSQGSQRLYTVSNTDFDTNSDTTSDTDIPFRHLQGTLPPPPPRLRRARNYEDSIVPDYITISQHQTSDFCDTPYLTPQATQVMKYVSSDDQDNTTTTN